MGNEVSSFEQPSECSAHTTPHPQCQRCGEITGISLFRESQTDSVINATRCRWHTIAAPHPRCPDCNPPPSLNLPSSNTAQGPIYLGPCQVHTSTNLLCVRCNGAPFAELVSSSGTRRCRWHTAGAPHPHCPECSPQLLLLPPSSAGTVGPADPGSCQVHMSQNPYCERCNGAVFLEIVPDLLPTGGAWRNCSLHATLTTLHPTCDRCNRLTNPPPPTNHVEALEGFDARSFAVTSCNVHSRRASGCRACYTAARREQIINGISQTDVSSPNGLGNNQEQHFNTNDAPGESRLNDLPSPSANNVSRPGLTQQPSSTLLRCRRHTSSDRNPHCQTCNEAFLQGLTAMPTPETSLISPVPRRCNRHELSAPNPNCQSCISVYTAQQRRDRVAASDDPEELPPPAYHAVQADRVIALGLPYPTLRVPSYTSMRAYSMDLPSVRDGTTSSTTEQPPAPFHDHIICIAEHD